MSDTREEQVRWPDGTVTLETVAPDPAGGECVVQSHRGVVFRAPVGEDQVLTIVHGTVGADDSAEESPDAQQIQQEEGGGFDTEAPAEGGEEPPAEEA